MRSLKPLSEQTVVITGASSGIGLATALAAARKGARVVLAARDEAVLAATAKAICDDGGEAIHVVADVAKRKDVEAIAEAAIKAYGGFDTWVNNAGVGIIGRIADVSEEDHRHLFDTNFWGVVHGSIVAAKAMAIRGGAIINLGSVASDVGLPLQGMYSASKHAVKGFSDALRIELQAAEAPVSVTLIKPASIDTPFALHARNYTQGTPTLPSPVYRPEDVAKTILFAAEHGGRDYYIGSGAKVLGRLNNVIPALADWLGVSYFMGKTVRGGKPSDAEAKHNQKTNGFTRGDSPHLVRQSIYAKLERHPIYTATAVALLGVGVASLIISGRRAPRGFTARLAARAADLKELLNSPVVKQSSRLLEAQILSSKRTLSQLAKRIDDLPAPDLKKLRNSSVAKKSSKLLDAQVATARRALSDITKRIDALIG